ncbi:hypothetical protein [Amycolatopsis thermoflava]|uniref:hypothetical protein n=1 Tax=Amycolatopsis thermoflava TaxID=84480 RepID=UPI0036529FF5
MRRTLVLTATLATIIATAAPSSADAGPPPTTCPAPGTDLLDGGRGWTSGLNDRGAVIGFHEVGGQIHGFVWRDGDITDIAPPSGGDYSSTSAVNRRGEVTGSRGSRGGPVPIRAFVWRDGITTDLPVPGGTSSAGPINERGQIAGTAVDSAGITRAVLWTRDEPAVLPDLGGSYSTVLDLNDRGQAAGYSELPGDGSRAVLWTGGRVVDLGPGRAIAVNDRGQVLVERSAVGEPTTGFLWEDGRTTTLAANVTGVTGLNEHGQVIGAYTPAGAAESHGFLWTRGRIADLGPVSPTDVNDRGQVLAETTSNGPRRGLVIDRRRTYTLTPAGGGPDSATVALNNRGLVAGLSQTGGTAVLWRLSCTQPPAGPH